ncbi:cytochrome c oxidase subunit II [Christiangramia fulva]|uniref:cytochrome-c oxidase n=1 Tax=Christiangramia fulva TaxID=2126553 RepID=A0A2R3Z8U0_9FLAO|nr:cytochrome c oxidase subunit II [Christiangramia fulva]AVR46622.1 cytochrome c oxidase subunit II [Christiangramia fulva]
MDLPEVSSINIIKDLFFYFLGAAVIVLGLVSFYTIFYSWKYRRRKNSKDEEPEQIHENRKFEFWMIGLALALVTGFFFYSLNAMNRIQGVPEHPDPELVIVGHQWWWEANYPKDNISTANEVHIPAGKMVHVKFTSADVIHSWWIPKIGRKMDLMPGYDNYMSIYVDKPGVYRGSCSEFCGDQHGWMKIRLIAHTPEGFERWKKQEHTHAPGEQDSLFYRGQQLFHTKSCTSCHSTIVTKKNPNIGPNLANFASREYFLSNVKKNNTANLKAWLRDPQQLKPGAHMPNFALTTEEVNALTHYLQNLK